jgi:hypothetical protein
MRRSRYTGFYRTFAAKNSGATDESPSVPSVTYAEIHRELCRHWQPRGEFLKIIDSKRREWLVYDASGTASFRYEYSLGSPRAFVRVFWREDHVREARLGEDADHATDTTTIRRRLRYSRRVDFPEQADTLDVRRDSRSLRLAARDGTTLNLHRVRRERAAVERLARS